MSELVKEIERQLGNDMIEEGNMTAYDVLEIIKNFKQPQLNENQQIVLDWLKEKMTKESRGSGFEFALWWLLDDFGTDELSNPTTTLFGRMNGKQRKEVLSAFIAWGLEQEESE
ncbi:hypothetical protein [Enterococcus sp. DIV0996a]|uniref:hypothetical protein n=1 Tax=Enterococcus sp. DIV0996a TaxID=2774790 RepID=UPI003F21FE2B